MRSTRQARIGDTFYMPEEWSNTSKEVQPLPGYEPARQMLFASVYPVDSGELENLFAAVDRLCLNDSSISVVKDLSASSSLGSGLRCGFLGFLHMEVFIQRLLNEFQMEVVLTTPSVPYRINFVDQGNTEIISNIGRWPEMTRDNSFEVEEPIVKVVIVTPKEYYGAVVDIVKDKRGDGVDITYLEDGNVKIESMVPWQEVVCDMSDMIKQCSAGYASLNYVEAGYKKSELVKVEIAVNGTLLARDPF